VRVLVRAAFVIGYKNGDHCIMPEAEIVFEGNRIVFVGHGFDGHCDDIIEAGNAIVAPGFIDLDALADIDHALIDTWQDDETVAGLDWSEDYFLHARRDVLAPEEQVFKRLFAFTHLIRNGVTTAMPIAAETHNRWAETYDELAGAARAAAKLGLRTYMGPSYRSGVTVRRAGGARDVLFDEVEGERGLADAVRFARDFPVGEGGLVRGCLLPCRIETLSPELLRKTAQAQDELGCVVRLHCLQSRFEIDFLRQRYGRTPLEMLEEAGLLGPQLLIPHGILIRGHSLNPGQAYGEIEKIAASGATVIHCPLATARYCMALESFDRFRRAGVNMAMGTDTFPPDMIRNMDYGSNISKIMDGSFAAGNPADQFRAATLGGANALGRKDLGRLAPGAAADLIVVDLADARIGVVDDPIRTLLMNCGGANVRSVIIDGRFVMRDWTLAAVDDVAMRQQAQACFDKIKAAYSERDFRGRGTHDLFPPAFPVN
jgi:cytosine/adenosine deaminase-related metal-dependent hydrolase